MTIAALAIAIASLLVGMLALLLSLAQMRVVTRYILSGRIEIRNECSQDGADELPDSVLVRTRLYDRAACCIVEVERRVELEQTHTGSSMEGYYALEMEPTRRFGIPDHWDAPDVLSVPGGQDVCRAILCPPEKPACRNAGPKDPIPFQGVVTSHDIRIVCRCEGKKEERS